MSFCFGPQTYHCTDICTESHKITVGFDGLGKEMGAVKSYWITPGCDKLTTGVKNIKNAIKV